MNKRHLHTILLVAAVVCFSQTPLFADDTNLPSTKPKTEIIDISNLLEGRIIIVKWQGLPIGVYKRTKRRYRITSQKAINWFMTHYSQKQSLPDWWQADIDASEKASLDFLIYLATHCNKVTKYQIFCF